MERNYWTDGWEAVVTGSQDGCLYPECRRGKRKFNRRERKVWNEKSKTRNWRSGRLNIR
jgi:hypothetical protein